MEKMYPIKMDVNYDSFPLDDKTFVLQRAIYVKIKII